MDKLILLITLFCSTPGHAEPVPPPRYSFSLAYDESRAKLVMFGGSNKGQGMNDTWEWDGVMWEMKSNEGPSPRNGPAMVYDHKRSTIILFGGEGGTWNNKKSYGDTWEWNGQTWNLLSTDGPPGRANHTLAYDKQRDKVVLFGGVDNQKTMGDLWEWDGKKWDQKSITDGPKARFLHGSAYDEKNKIILIFGGNTLVGPPTQESIKGDLWSWNGNKWNQYISDGTAPSPRDHVDMIYDPSKMKVIVHGGGQAAGDSAIDTWEWDGKKWSALVTNSNAPVEGYKLVYDSKSKAVLLFGGFVGGSPSSSLWKLSGHAWYLIK